MTHPNRPVPPPVQEMWKTFVTTAHVEDSERTITSFELRAARETKALIRAPQGASVVMADLPSMPVTTKSKDHNELVTSDFEVTGVLGEGGMGRVLLARQKSLQRDVALKVLNGEESRREVVDTLLAEAVITGSILFRQLVIFPATLFFLFVGMFVVVRKRITTSIGRRAFGLLLLYPVASVAHRAFAMAMGDSIPSILTTDLVFSAILSLSFAITILPRIGWLSAVLLPGAVAISMYPNHATILFVASASLAAVLMAGLWMRMVLQEKT